MNVRLISTVLCSCSIIALNAGANELTTNPAGVSSISEDFANSENEELIVAVKYRKKQFLSQGMAAYAVGGDIALPLEQLMFLVEFPIQVASGSRKAAGWFIRENRRFSLNLDTLTVVSDGKNFKIPKGQIKVVGGEVYVPSKLLAQWFPLDINSDLRALGVTIFPREKTAIDKKNEREKRRFGSAYQVSAKNPEQRTPYNLITPPSINANLGVGYNSSSERDILSNYSIRAFGDLAYMSGELALIGNQEELTDARLKLSRSNPRGGLLGVMNATRFDIGDISGTAIPLVGFGAYGRGIQIARRPNGYVGGLETITIEGIKNTGYDVELYRNNILVNAIQSGSATRYEFKDLDLLSGLNEFRIEFYGPQGQRNTRIEQYYAGTGNLKKGEVNYDVSISQPGKTVFDVGSRSSTNYTGSDLVGSARVDYGINSKLSVRGGGAFIPITDSDKRLGYAFLGATSEYGGYINNLDLAYDDNNGSAWGYGVSKKLGNLDIALSYRQYSDNYFSNRSIATSDQTGLKSRVTVGVNRHSRRTSNKKILFSVGAKASESRYYDGRKDQGLDLDLTGQYKRLQVATSLNYSRSSSSSNDVLSGRTQVSIGSLNYGSLRLSADYKVRPDQELTNTKLSFHRRLSNRRSANETGRLLNRGLQMSVGYEKDHIADTSSISASLNKPFKFATVGLTATRELESLDGNDDTSVFLTIDFGTFTDKKTMKTRFFNDNRTLAATRVKTFLDENRNSVFDIGEAPLADVSLRGYNRTTGKTNANGEALLIGVANNDWVDIGINPSGISEPYTQPANNGFAVLNRPGVVSELSMPVIYTSEVEGTVMMLKPAENDSMPLANVEIQALQRNPKTGKTEIVGRTTTSFDGFYALANIPVGQFELRIDPAQLKRLAIKNGQSKQLKTNKNQNFLAGQNFNLQRN